MAARLTESRRDGSYFRLSVLFLGAAALAGCGPRPAPSSAVAPVSLPPLSTTPGAVTLTAYLPLHPAATELRRLDAAIKLLSRPSPVPSAPLAPPPPLPQAVETPIAPELGPTPGQHPNAVRAADAIAEDYALRKLARPDTAGEQYQRELNRLERQYLEQRQQPRDAELVETQAESQRFAEESSRLNAELRRLRERPGDRLRYGAVQVEQRRRDYQKVEAQLEALRREEVARVGALLEPEPGKKKPLVPPEMVKAAEQRRDEARSQADAALQREEAAAVDAVRATQLPPPTMELPSAPEITAAVPVPAALMRRPRSSAASPSSGASAATLRTLREARAALLRGMLADLRVAALTAGREAGVDVTFTPGQAPDQTAALTSRVRRLVRWGRAGGTG